MKHAPGLDSIENRLRHALAQFGTPPGGSVPITGIPLSSWQLKEAVKNMLEGKNVWLAAVPAFQDVQNWVQVHWNTERETQPPAGTVSDGEEWGHNGDVQLDTPTATCKLLLAAAWHGVEAVAKYAIEFAAHGMIEVRSFYLLKGASLSSAEPLDEYCTLLPYQKALQKIDADPSQRRTDFSPGWPTDPVGDVCALQVRSFERRGIDANDFERHVSTLLQHVPTMARFYHGSPILRLVDILGLVWGKGLHIFGNAHFTPESVVATLPFFHTQPGGGKGTSQVQFLILSPTPHQRRLIDRPINTAELAELIDGYAVLPEQTQHVLSLALRRMRDSTERLGLEDKVIDVCIALEALFMETGEYKNQHDIIARRGSWFFADSRAERDQTRADLKAFYKHRSEVVHGRTLYPEYLTVEDNERTTKQLADIENVVRASLKTMISEGRPQDWEESRDFKAIRRDPPRAETEIPSVKSDSLCWSVKEQKGIDQALEAVWKPEVDDAPLPPPEAVSGSHLGIDAEGIERCRQEGTPYLIVVPIRLYMAHPKWPKQEGDPVDERTKYYCDKDVERHLLRWKKAASEKKIYQFELPLEEPAVYLPKTFDIWRELLQRGAQP
ncbi:MAG: HEPN domain-containing protein [Gemmatimonadota bacterium]|nr:HEPN domain-containing protein [Gemmatimonadota bacterium]